MSENKKCEWEWKRTMEPLEWGKDSLCDQDAINGDESKMCNQQRGHTLIKSSGQERENESETSEFELFREQK